MYRCRRITGRLLFAVLCGVIVAVPRVASADDPAAERQNAELLIAQASAILSAPPPQEHALRLDIPEGRSLTSLLNEIKVEDARVGPLALGRVGPFLTRPLELGATFATPHFLFHYAPDGTDSPAAPIADYLAVAGEACERAWQVHHGEGVWPTPISGAASDGRVDVYVRDLGWGAYGYSLHESTAEQTGESGFIVVDNDFAGHPTLGAYDALRVTLAHEYQHLVQFSFGYAPEADWFMEQSAVMMEGQIYPEITDRYRHLSYFASSPYRRLDLSNGSFEYGAWLWPQFLLEHRGWGAALLVDAWRAWSDRTGTMLQALDRALGQRGSSLRAAFGEWTIWNAFLGQPDDGTHYADLGAYPVSIWQETTVVHFPADGVSPAVTHQPEPLGASYVVLLPDAATGHDRLDLKVTTGGGALGATLITWPRNGGAATVQPIALEGGAGGLLAMGWNEVERACLVLAVAPEATSTCAYTVSAHTRFSSADVGPDPVAVDRLSLHLSPNPSEARTTIAYALPADAPVLLRIFDAGGRLVDTVLDRAETAGAHQLAWDGPGAGASVASGVYFCEIRTPGEVQRVRLIRTR